MVMTMMMMYKDTAVAGSEANSFMTGLSCRMLHASAGLTTVNRASAAANSPVPLPPASLLPGIPCCLWHVAYNAGVGLGRSICVCLGKRLHRYCAGVPLPTPFARGDAFLSSREDILLLRSVQTLFYGELEAQVLYWRGRRRRRRGPGGWRRS